MNLKTLLCALCIVLCGVINAQNSNTNWNSQQEKILDKFQLTKQDTRGVELHTDYTSLDCTNKISISEALLNFLNAVKASDYTHYCIKDESSEQFSSFLNRPLDIYEITRLYVQLKALNK
jgi:hypothetical protein